MRPWLASSGDVHSLLLLLLLPLNPKFGLQYLITHSVSLHDADTARVKLHVVP
jgi:hypothetical protein